MNYLPGAILISYLHYAEGNPDSKIVMIKIKPGKQLEKEQNILKTLNIRDAAIPPPGPFTYHPISDQGAFCIIPVKSYDVPCLHTTCFHYFPYQ